MNDAQWQATAAWNELLAGLAELQDTFLGGDRAVEGERAVAEGYRMLATILAVSLDIYLFSDKQRPAFVDTVNPHRRDRRWGGDNTDAYYSFVMLDPARTYRIGGRRNDSAYFSLTIYNEPAPGAWSDKVIGVVNDADLEFGPDGEFEFYIGPRRPPGYDGPFVELTADAAAGLTRDYQADPLAGRPVEWRVEVLEEPEPLARTDAETARALRSTLTWMRTMFMIVPMKVGTRVDDDRLMLGHETANVANTMAAPYRVPDFNFGWSATDATYAFGSYDLAEDEALVITHRPPDCRFWNAITWHEYMAGQNTADGATSVNSHSARRNPDGTVTIVIARHQLEHPNAISTMDRERGMIAFRWFLADEVPAAMTVELVRIKDAPVAL
jgi:hypothetical protein